MHYLGGKTYTDARALVLLAVVEQISFERYKAPYENVLKVA